MISKGEILAIAFGPDPLSNVVSGFYPKTGNRLQQRMLMRAEILPGPTPVLMMRYDPQVEDEIWQTVLLNFGDSASDLVKEDVEGEAVLYDGPKEGAVWEFMKRVNDPDQPRVLIPPTADLLDPKRNSILEAAMCLTEEYYRRVHDYARIESMLERRWRVTSIEVSDDSILIHRQRKPGRMLEKKDVAGRAKDHDWIYRIRLAILHQWEEWKDKEYTWQEAANQLVDFGCEVSKENLRYHATQILEHPYLCED